MAWLIDDNVPRPVTRFLQDRGDDAVEARAVLGPKASDIEIATLARQEDRRIVTHDVRFARRCLLDRSPHLWLRTKEFEDVVHLRQSILQIISLFEAGATRVVLTSRQVTSYPEIPE